MPDCSACGAASAGKQCLQCSTHYCDKACQKADWKRHKKVCASLCRASNTKHLASEATARSVGTDDSGIARLREIQASAEEGDLEAQFLMGCGHEHGWISLENSTFWLKKAARGGHLKAQYNLGCAYKDGSDGLTLNHETSVGWFAR